MFEGLFQPMHLLVLLGTAVFVFGPKKIPELGKGLGEGIRGFKAALQPDGSADRSAAGNEHTHNVGGGAS
jgi:sec-independent protein translocase protein TatA